MNNRKYRVALNSLFLRIDDKKEMVRLTVIGECPEIGNLRRDIYSKHTAHKHIRDDARISSVFINFANGQSIPKEHIGPLEQIIATHRGQVDEWVLPALKLVYHSDSTLRPETNIWVKDLE